MKIDSKFRVLLGAMALGLASATFAGPAVDDPATDELQANVMNLSQLEDRLRATKAIGALKKLSLKSEIDGLLAKFRTAHASGNSGPQIRALRQPYNSLIARIEGMLGRDPELARDIVAARDAIFERLADRTQFALLE